MKIDYLLANDNDNHFLASVCREADIYYKNIMPGSFEKQATRFERFGLPASYKVYLIRTNKCKIGFLGFATFTDSLIYLTAFYLRLKYQQQGIGSKILKQFMYDAHTNGYKEIVLLTHKDTFWAINFYKKNNFEIVTEDFTEIKSYALGALEKFAIPSTILLRINI